MLGDVFDINRECILTCYADLRFLVGAVQQVIDGGMHIVFCLCVYIELGSCLLAPRGTQNGEIICSIEEKEEECFLTHFRRTR